MNSNRTCPHCKQEKPIEDFTFSTGKTHSWCKACRLVNKQVWWEKNREKINARRRTKTGRELGRLYERKHRQVLKERVIMHYSNGTRGCAHCGEGDIIVLCIDHINGNGNVHRRSINKTSGAGFYGWLIQNNYPKGFQVLCYNCNMRKRWEQQEYGVTYGSNL